MAVKYSQFTHHWQVCKNFGPCLSVQFFQPVTVPKFPSQFQPSQISIMQSSEVKVHQQRLIKIHQPQQTLRTKKSGSFPAVKVRSHLQFLVLCIVETV